MDARALETDLPFANQDCNRIPTFLFPLRLATPKQYHTLTAHCCKEMAQSTIRRHQLLMGVAFSIVFACTIGYMANTHVDVCKYDRLQEVQRRAVAAVTLLELMPTVAAATDVLSAMTSMGSSHTVTLSTAAAPVTAAAYGSSTFPYSATVVSVALGQTITVTESGVYEQPLTCRPLVVGQGLCLLICCLCVQLMLSQAGNLLAQKGERILSITASWLAHMGGIGFIVGAVVLMGSTQRSCRMYAQAEGMQSTLQFYSDVVLSVKATDPTLLTGSIISAVNDRLTYAFGSGNGGARVMLSSVTSTFPSNLTYYETFMDGGLSPASDYFAFTEDSWMVTGTSSFLDALNTLVWYIQEAPIESYVLDDSIVSRALPLGLVPMIAVIVVGIVFLPYSSLGSLENGEDGWFPSEWRLSLFAAEVKFTHVFAGVLVVLCMSTIALSSCNANLAIQTYMANQIIAYDTSSSTAASVSEALFTNIASIAQLTYSQLSLPTTVVSSTDLVTLQSYYSQLYSRQGTIRYNISSVSDQLRSATTLPLLLNRSSIQSILGVMSSGNASLFGTYAASLDLAFIVFAQNAELTPFNTAKSTAYGAMLALSKESATISRLFTTAWAAYSAQLSTYTNIASSFASQAYTPADVRSFMASSSAATAHALEDSILYSVSDSNKDPIPPSMTSVPYAQFQIQQALSLTLAAIILISAAAVFDAWYSHVFFALGHKWVPVNDPTAARSRLKFDSGRLWGNVRVIVPCCVAVCVVMVVLASIVYAQGNVDANLEATRRQSTADVLRARRQMLSVQTDLIATSFWWNRAVLSRQPTDLSLAVSGVLQWSNYLSSATSTWPGPATAATRINFLAAVKSMESVTRDVVLVCGFRIISLSYEYDQLSDITTFVDNLRPDVATMKDCLGASSSTALLTAVASFETAVERKLSSTVTAAYLTTISAFTSGVSNASCTAVDSYIANMVFYGRYFLGLSLADGFRLPPSALSSRLETNATNVESAALSYLTTYLPLTLQRSSSFALFWVPVLLAWCTVLLAHLAYRRSADSVQSINYVS